MAGYCRLHRPGEFPMVGCEAVSRFVETHKLEVEEWEEIEGGVAPSGELGYTYGRYEIRLDGAGEAAQARDRIY